MDSAIARATRHFVGRFLDLVEHRHRTIESDNGTSSSLSNRVVTNGALGKDETAVRILRRVRDPC